MIYSSLDNVEEYLSNYNIVGVQSTKTGQFLKFRLKNIHTNKEYDLRIEYPLYNIISKAHESSATSDNAYEFDESRIVGHEIELKKMMFDNEQTQDQFNSKFLNSDYYKRYGIIEHEANSKYSSEYFSYLEFKDVDRIRELSGFKDNKITGIYGNFFTMDDNTLRFMFKPTTPVLENVSEVFFAQANVFTLNNQQYPIYYIVYTTTDKPKEVKFEWSNLLVNSITGNGTVTTNLSTLFGDKWLNIYDDMKTLNGHNTKWFIVNNIFSTAIFYNTPSGIIRYIPINYTSDFFNIIFNNIKLYYDLGIDTQQNEGGVRKYKNITDPNATDTHLDSVTEYTKRPVSHIYQEDRIVPQTEMEHVEFLNQLVGLVSTAEYFNDVLFSMNDTEFEFPVYLVNEENEAGVQPAMLPGQENSPVIYNTGKGGDIGTVVKFKFFGYTSMVIGKALTNIGDPAFLTDPFGNKIIKLTLDVKNRILLIEVDNTSKKFDANSKDTLNFSINGTVFKGSDASQFGHLMWSSISGVVSSNQRFNNIPADLVKDAKADYDTSTKDKEYEYRLAVTENK